MTLSSRGLDFIKREEGFRDHAYQDQAGIWTIGYGTIRYPDGRRVTSGDICTEPQASHYLQHRVDEFVQHVNRHVCNPELLTQGQFDALVSFVYNIGTTNFGPNNSFEGASTLLQTLNGVGPSGVTKSMFTRWHKVRIKGVLTPSQGLKNRREREYALFRSSSEEGD